MSTTPLGIERTSTMRLIFALVLIILSLTFARAYGGPTVTLTATDRGWYNETGFHNQNLIRYNAGEDGNDFEYRNFFVFDLSGISTQIVGAELQLNTYQTDIYLQTEETYQLHAVSTALSTLTAGGSGLTAIFDDLGDGATFGSRVFNSNEDDITVTIDLNSAFVTAANAAAGSGSVALGGAITTLDPNGGNSQLTEQVFYDPTFPATVLADSQLVLELIPLPQTATMGGMLLAVAALMRRPKRG